MSFAESLQLVSPRLRLSPLAMDDAATLFAIQSDPAVMRYWNHAAWTEIGQARAAIAQARQAMADGTRLTLGVREHEGGALVGTCLLFAIDASSGRAEVGYNLASSAQGRGYMHEALDRLVAHAFTDLALRRLEAEIDPRNVPSARVLERLGFRQEGLLRERWQIEGEISDSALYGLLAREDAARRDG